MLKTYSALGSDMADSGSSKKSAVKKGLIKPALTEAETRKAVWDKAEKSLVKGKYEGALDSLRTVDPSGEHPTTLRIAGEATWAKAKDTLQRNIISSYITADWSNIE